RLRRAWRVFRRREGADAAPGRSRRVHHRPLRGARAGRARPRAARGALRRVPASGLGPRRGWRAERRRERGRPAARARGGRHSVARGRGSGDLCAHGTGRPAHGAAHAACGRGREREATNLARVTAHLASSLQLDRVLDLITWSAKELLRCDAAAVWRYDDGRDGLVAYRASGMPIERISHVVVKPGQGLAGRVLKERKPLWTRQLTRSLQDDAPDASETATALG